MVVEKETLLFIKSKETPDIVLDEDLSDTKADFLEKINRGGLFTPSDALYICVLYARQLFKKIFDKANTAAQDKGKKEKTDKTGDQVGHPVTNLLETYSKILTHSYFSLKRSPFLMTIPISLQHSLTLSKKSLDTLER